MNREGFSFGFFIHVYRAIKSLFRFFGCGYFDGLRFKV